MAIKRGVISWAVRASGESGADTERIAALLNAAVRCCVGAYYLAAWKADLAGRARGDRRPRGRWEGAPGSDPSPAHVASDEQQNESRFAHGLRVLTLDAQRRKQQQILTPKSACLVQC